MSVSRGGPALRMRVLTRAILTSATSSKHIPTNVYSKPKCNPSAWVGPWWQGHTGKNCLKTKDVGEQRRLGFAGDRDAPGGELAICKLEGRSRG